MKLFLTSTGLENKEISRNFEMMFLPKEPKDLSFLVVSIQDSEQDAFYLEKKTLNEIKKTGAVNIDVFKLRNEKFVADKEYDVVFVCGGNTFDYLDRIRKTGLADYLLS
ncbi:MAG: Type 1 glutamine amidotransferase-like domain-containing protein, partial [Clostridia bacterium]|nr:Type 1 glutamine amidotransferase-like domain-containing protein [Clostridia bacterium]